MGVDLSIIVPVYNVEKYVRKCLDSILAQTFTDFELIVVNDGSTDNSRQICESYAAKDFRVKVVTQPNMGVSAARNRGLAMASGEWIGFVDADDYIDDGFYRCLMDAAKTETADMICCGVRVVDENGEEHPHLQCDWIPQKPVLLSPEKAYLHFLHPSHRFLYWSPWDKIIRGSVARQFSFEPGRKYGEDFYYCAQCLSKCSGVYYIPEKKYNYYLRPGSAVRSGRFDESSFDSVYFAEKVLKDMADADEKGKLYAQMNLLIVAARTVRSYYQLDNGEKEKLLPRIQEVRRLIRHGSFKAKMGMKLTHQVLLLEASRLPMLFQVR